MLTIPRQIFVALLAHAREGFPLEVCGILGGTAGQVSAIFPMTNTDASAEHFMMDPKEQFAVMKELRRQGQEMLAIYHSHPASPARPSAEDIRLALTPDVAHAIISLQDPEHPVVKLFQITEGLVTEVEVTIG
ncbi:MAG TPA: M67 family metallopeptidase [Geobacteraceae bacterium]